MMMSILLIIIVMLIDEINICIFMKDVKGNRQIVWLFKELIKLLELFFKLIYLGLCVELV